MLEQSTIEVGMFGQLKRHTFIATLFVALGVIAIFGTVFWVGYQGSDDGSYVDGALAWYRQFPYLGRSHWDLRYPILLPIDAAFWIFGISEFAVGAAMLAYLFGLVAVSIRLLQRWFGVVESLIFIVIFCAMPGITAGSTYANAETPELFYVVVSLALYCAAFESTHARALLFCAGLAAGLAFATRETTLGLIVAYGLLFLLRPGTKRTDYLIIGIGFAVIIFLEMTYYIIEAGNPLWRFKLDVHHDAVNRSAVLTPGQTLDNQGNIGGSLAPLLIFFASQKFALIFYLMLGLLPLLVRGGWGARQQIVLVTLGALFVGWAGQVIFNVWLLYLVPRYLMVTAWVAAMLGAIGLTRLWERQPRLAGFALAAVLLADAACLYVENLTPNQASRAAIEVAVQHHEPVYTDSFTRRRGRFIAQRLGIADDIKTGKPPPGALYVLAPDNLPQCHEGSCEIVRTVLNDLDHWQEIERIAPPPRAIGGLLDALQLTPMIPGDIRKKLIQPNSGVIVYRVR